MTGLVSRRARVGGSARGARRVGANIVVGLGAGALCLSAGCIDRPVAPIEPYTTNLFANQIEVTAIEAIDLLFVVDNSVSMADKQKLLRDAVPLMVRRLIQPDCVDQNEGRHPDDGQSCSSYGAEFFPEFRPVNDIHLGVITSSLGGFGSTSCNQPADDPDDLDKSRLIPLVRDVVESTGEAVPNPTGHGFLAWNGVPDGGDAESALATLENDLALHVAAAGENGCGFEAPLEAWYRFLVDPAPPLDVVVEDKASVSTGVDTAILEQRAEFLRPGSLVAIVVLTDENDCSVMEGGNVYPFAGSGYVLPSIKSPFTVASAACADNPNDPCCYSCALTAPEGCTDTCERPDSPKLAPEDDRANARCFDGKRRFGVDLLYPTSRYVDGLTKSVIVNSHTGESVQNPLLAERSPDRVFFAGIVGVPWQDVATDDSLEDPTSLRYRSAAELDLVDETIGGNRWELLLGRPSKDGEPPHPPLDPFLIESIEPRSGTHPITGDSIIGLGGSGWSSINGHEYDNSVPTLEAGGGAANDDLQYSCIFPLEAGAIKENCSGGDNCDCSDEPRKGRPLCKSSPDASTAADTTQRYGKAYPPSRILRVLRDFGDNSIVASICPKIEDQESPSFGYNPAVNAIVDRLATKLNGQCLPRTLTVTKSGVPCVVVEATKGSASCDATQRRAELTDSARASVERRMADGGTCKQKESDDGPLPLCSEFTVCEILEADDAGKAACFGSTAPESQAPGYCYIDPAKGPNAGGLPTSAGSCVEGDPASWDGCINPNVAACGATERRMLRFVGERTPQPNSTTYVACAGDAASDDQKLPPLPDE